MDAKLMDEKARRQQRIDGEGNGIGTKKSQVHDQQNFGCRSRALPTLEANAELQVNLDVSLKIRGYHLRLLIFTGSLDMTEWLSRFPCSNAFVYRCNNLNDVI